MMTNPPGSPGSHPHADRPNWRLAEMIDEYWRNCQEGLEQWSDRRAAKLLGWSRVRVYRARLMSSLPEELFERLVKLASSKELAAIAVWLNTGDFPPIKNEHCPHCGEVLRKRWTVRPVVMRAVRDWAQSVTETSSSA
jgi:hypothetical protein